MRIYAPEGWHIENADARQILTTPTALYDAAGRGDILEGKAIMCDSDHNLIVDLGCMRGIIPRDEGAIGITSGRVKDIALISRVGKAVKFTVKSINTDSKGRLQAVLSRREAQERCYKNYISFLTPGDIIEARVTHLENFGVFCDIGCGNIALIPIDLISVSRISHPKDRFSVGQDIKAVVKSIDEQGRITLSHKELLGTWEENAALFSQGQTVSGIIRSVEDYGVFIELTPNLAGLAEVREGISVGNEASVYIKSLIPEKMKVKLIIIDSFCQGYTYKDTKYFVEDGHIDRWVYSPSGCKRTIETVFKEEY